MMTNRLKSFFVMCAFVLSLGSIAFAQETTGTIEGTITDPTGAVVPGVEVTIKSRTATEGGRTNTAVGFNRTVTTDSNGFYRVPQIPPGFYTVSTAATSGFGTATANNIEVVLGKTTPVNVALAAGTQNVEVNVTADTLAIDPTDNKIQTNITQRTAELLPKGVNFTSLLQVAPAVRNEPLSGGFQIDGASGSENTFVIDGQEVSNFRTGTLNANNNLPFQIVQEVQVKSSGFNAEFGGATGGVINVVTRGGGNDFRGEFGAEFTVPKFEGNPRPFLNLTNFTGGRVAEYIPRERDRGTDFFPFATLGGPIIKDRAWFFGSYSLQQYTLGRTVRLFGSDLNPATRTLGAPNEYRQIQKNEYAFGRIDLQPFQKLRLTGTYNYNPLTITGNPPAQSPFGTVPAITFPGRGVVSGPALSDLQGGRQNANNTTGTLVYTPTNNLVISVRGGYSFLNEKLGNYGVPSVVGQTRYSTAATGTAAPTGFPVAGTSNFPSFSQLLFDVSRRRTFDGDVSYLVGNFFGRHQFKGGVQFNGISNNVQSTLVDTIVFRFGADQSIQAQTGRSDAPARSANAIGIGFLQRFGTFGAAGSDNLAFYLQDSWQPFNRLTLNLGVRTERENSPSFNDLGDGIKFGFGDKIAPRLGFALDLFGDGKTKVFGFYGWFYDRFKYELPRGSFGGNFFRNDYFEIFPGQTSASFTRQSIIGSLPDPIGGTCPINNSSVQTRCQLDFRIPSNLPGQPEFGQIDPDIQAFRNSEYTFGIERAVGANFLVRGRYTHKQVDVAVEDIGIPVPGGEAYIIGNPGRGLAKQSAEANGFFSLDAVRDYDAVEIGLDKRFVNNYYFNVNYTYSRLFGNYAGLASSDEAGRTSPNVNRNYDLPFIGYTSLGQPDNGRLATDRPHVFRAYGAYEIPWSTSNSTEISGFTSIQSGTPLTTRYTVFGVAGQILNGRGDLGRTEVFTQTDLGLRHKYRFGRENRFTMIGLIDIINLFNEDNVLGVDENLTTAGLTGANLGFSSNLSQLQQEALYQRQNTNATANAYIRANNLVNPTFNLANLFQGPRNVRFGVRLQF